MIRKQRLWYTGEKMGGIFMKKKVLSIALCMAMIATLIGCGNKEEADSKPIPYEITQVSIPNMMGDPTNVWVYNPTEKAGVDFPLEKTYTASALLVYGDKSQYDEAGAAEFIQSTGLDKIAASQAGTVILINGSDEAGWGEADAAGFATVAGALTNSVSEFENGVATSKNMFTGADESKILGSTEKLYVYAYGAGADFMATYGLVSQAVNMTFPDGVTISFDYTPAGVTLVDATVVPTIDPTIDPTSADYKSSYRVAAVNCPEGTEEALSVLGDGNYIVEDAEDTKEWVVNSYETFVSSYRRQAGILVKVHNYEEEGIVEVEESYEVTTSADNVAADSETYQMGYVTYYGKDTDVKEGSLALVLVFHGGGGTAQGATLKSEWPLIAAENDMIVVAVDQHTSTTATEVVDLIEHLKTEYPAINPEKIYATGFSMGGCKSWDLYEQYPEVFAGLAPFDASFEPGIDGNNAKVENTNQDTIVPLFYVGGVDSPLAELPCQSETLVNRLSYVFGVNDLTTAYNVSFAAKDSWANPIWGISGDKVYTLDDPYWESGSILTVNMFQSSDGHYYTAFGDAASQSHEYYARNARAAWDFLKQFSRTADGKIVIENVDYDFASQDGSVADNSYNR